MSVAALVEQPVAPVLGLENIRKEFGGIVALENVTVAVAAGEVLALVGDNGAGKSTLINILSGVHTADQGEITVEGRTVRIAKPRDAMDLGIETIYQYNSMVPTMSIARNLFIGREPTRFSVFGVGLLDQKKMASESIRAIANVDLHLRSPDALVGELSGGQRQGVAIARATHWARKLVLMDEPTAALGVAETAKVEQIIRSLRARNLAILIVSHNLDQVFRIADRVCVLRRGVQVGWRRIDETTGYEIVAMITGLVKA